MRKKLNLIGILSLYALAITAQTTTDAPILGSDWLSQASHYGLFALGIYEVVIRFFPTVKSYSILADIMKFINVLLPDYNTEGGTHALQVRTLTTEDIRVGDTVKILTGDMMKVVNISYDGEIAVQDPTCNCDPKKIGIEDILEVVRQSYFVKEAIVKIFNIIKKWLSQIKG